ncbi:MAG: hypothetical protein J1E05_05980 [Eubacterium sp.]|nr:hypothetical protein [Eubacterium sp.]
MKQKSKRISRFGITAMTIAMIVAVVATSVFAAYLKNSVEVNNTFIPADSVTPEIIEKFEEFDNTVKKDLYFKVGLTEYPVYVRVAIVYTWQNESGIVYFSKPTEATPIFDNENEIIGYNGDYTISLNTGATDDWVLRDDGFYYFKSPVESNGKTSVLINECRQVNAAPIEGYTLSVEVIVQTVQAVGSTDTPDNSPGIDAWKNAWGIS